MEKDDEVSGNGNSVNYKYRMHDPRLGRSFAVDPLTASYPWNSPYTFSENTVIAATELEGLEANGVIRDKNGKIIGYLPANDQTSSQQTEDRSNELYIFKPKLKVEEAPFSFNAWLRRKAKEFGLEGEDPLENKSGVGEEHGGYHLDGKEAGSIGTNDHSNGNVTDIDTKNFPGTFNLPRSGGVKGAIETVGHIIEANDKGTNEDTQEAVNNYVTQPISNLVIKVVVNLNESDDTISVAGGGHNGETYYPNDTISTTITSTNSSGNVVNQSTEIYKGR